MCGVGFGIGFGNGFRVGNFFSASCLWLAISSVHLVLSEMFVPVLVCGWVGVGDGCGVGLGVGNWFRVGNFFIVLLLVVFCCPKSTTSISFIFPFQFVNSFQLFICLLGALEFFLGLWGRGVGFLLDCGVLWICLGFL